MRKFGINLLSGILILMIPYSLFAQNSTTVPGYTVHHNAFTTDYLLPQVAQTFNIPRSKNRGMLNVSIVKQGTLGQTVTAEVKAHAANLTGQTREIPMREIRDGDAIYYISDFRVANQETLDFVIKVKPEGSAEAYTAKLRQQFYTN
jgi:hypothetical protein